MSKINEHSEYVKEENIEIQKIINELNYEYTIDILNVLSYIGTSLLKSVIQ